MKTGGLKRSSALLILAAVSILGACSPAGPSHAAVPEQRAPQDSLPSNPPAALPTATQMRPVPAASPTAAPQAAGTQTILPQASATPALAETPAPCFEQVCWMPGHFWLSRPIAPPGRDQVDGSYRYGSTQAGLRETHHGVELLNSQGTPVLAAADGTVIVAGDDQRAIYADWPYFYGNLVILKHQIADLAQPVYSLYAHLFEVQTSVGAQVKAGDQIGLVGFSGTAEGSHLHFEVRVGLNEYDHTRNPELWLAPHLDPDGQPHGAIAGRAIDEFGAQLEIPNIVIERLTPDGYTLETYYLATYADSSVNGDDQWQENFAIGDLPAGKYRVSFVARGLQVYDIEVRAGMVTLIHFDAAQGKP